jgi:hypothetical protein
MEIVARRHFAMLPGFVEQYEFETGKLCGSPKQIAPWTDKYRFSAVIRPSQV